ncbi:MAG: FtsH protease activity modulator HflK, partial [Candidatus Binatia bacterium]
ERGIVLRFGRVVREAGPGPGYHLPWPVETVLKPRVTQIRKEEFGFRTLSVGPPARYRDVDREALMLTGDENIVKLQFIVQYRVKPGPSGATDFLFNVRDPRQTVRVAAEAAMRQVIGQNKIDDALTEGKGRIQEDTQRALQEILDSYHVGLQVVTVKLQDVDPPDQVSNAFKDVISAEQDKERLINEATGYANDVVPRARGQAAQLLNEAEGYRQAKVQQATGAAGRFNALYAEYAKAKAVTWQRLYIETMEEVLGRMNKILLDDVAGKRVVPYLPLTELMRPRRDDAAKQPKRQ